MIHRDRIRFLGDPSTREGSQVLSWMQAAQRVRSNHALAWAIDRANELKSAPRSRSEPWERCRAPGHGSRRPSPSGGLAPSGGHKEAFLEELLVRRELSFNFVHHNESHDRVEGLPSWAIASRTDHESDPRPHRYFLDGRDPDSHAALGLERKYDIHCRGELGPDGRKLLHLELRDVKESFDFLGAGKGLGKEAGARALEALSWTQSYPPQRRSETIGSRVPIADCPVTKNVFGKIDESHSSITSASGTPSGPSARTRSRRASRVIAASTTRLRKGV